MPALVAGIRAFVARSDVDGRDKPGHDAETSLWLAPGMPIRRRYGKNPA
jgi:hypothetical protein